MRDAVMASIEAAKLALEGKIDEIKNNPLMLEVLKIHHGLNSMEDLIGERRTTLSEIFKMDSEQGEPSPKPLLTRPDEFFSLDPVEAAKKFLRKKGHALHFNEIVRGIKAGGCSIPSEEKFRTTLGRSTFVFAKIDENHYGLLDFYKDEKDKRFKKVKERGAKTKSETSEE
ncbi:MAG: hypothetical protein HQK85_12395, partial [Nitrospinae bacterium]|nr:hypothetical protein [Nitrospinota bacterium]